MSAKVIKQGFIKVEGFAYKKLNELTFLCVRGLVVDVNFVKDFEKIWEIFSSQSQCDSSSMYYQCLYKVSFHFNQ